MKLADVNRHALNQAARARLAELNLPEHPAQPHLLALAGHARKPDEPDPLAEWHQSLDHQMLALSHLHRELTPEQVRGMSPEQAQQAVVQALKGWHPD